MSSSVELRLRVHGLSETSLGDTIVIEGSEEKQSSRWQEVLRTFDKNIVFSSWKCLQCSKLEKLPLDQKEYVFVIMLGTVTGDI
jgi:hypothetical protein